MSSEEHTGVLVAGGGVSGLTAAVALHRAGLPVKVLEAQPELRPARGAAQIWVNGMAALDRVGLGDGVRELGEPVTRFTFRSRSGRTLVRLPLDEIARARGSTLPWMARCRDLLRLLAGSLPEGTVELRAEVVAVEQRDDGVTVRLADGREERGAVLVAADGPDSRLRSVVAPEAEPRPQGYQYLRCLMHFEEFPAREFTFTFGPGDRFGVHSLGDGEVYWFGAILAEPGSGGPRREQLLERFADFPPPEPGMISAADEGAIGRADIRDLDPLEWWARGRVVLVGDAAHAMTPNLGRGAGEAIEDAVLLADELARADDLAVPGEAEAALAAFDARRRPAVAPVQRQARRIGRLASWRNPAATRVREGLFRTVVGRRIAAAFEREFGRAASLAG